MIIGRLICKNGQWMIVDQDGNWQLVDESQCMDLDMGEHWVKTKLKVCDHAILFDDEVYMTEEMLAEMSLRFRMYHLNEI